MSTVYTAGCVWAPRLGRAGLSSLARADFVFGISCREGRGDRMVVVELDHISRGLLAEALDRNSAILLRVPRSRLARPYEDECIPERCVYVPGAMRFVGNIGLVRMASQ